MNNLISLKILSPEKVVYEDDVYEVIIPTENGEIGVLKDHIPLVSLIKTGEIRIKKERDTNNTVVLSISGGILEVRPALAKENKNTQVIILSSSSEFASEIDIARAEEAYERAKRAMEEKENISDVDFAKFQAIMEKELNRVKIAKKWKI